MVKVYQCSFFKVADSLFARVYVRFKMFKSVKCVKYFFFCRIRSHIFLARNSTMFLLFRAGLYLTDTLDIHICELTS